MFDRYQRTACAAAGVQGVKLAALFAMLAIGFALPAAAQPGPRTFSCQSTNGERTVCRADMSRGEVRMTRQLGDVSCVEGYTWGRQDDGVWVDRGCRAEFILPPEPRRPRERLTRIESGMLISVRTNERITTDKADGRIFTGSVDQDVVGTNGHLAIPRGSNVELIVRAARDGDLRLDLESVMVDGQRYAVNAEPDHVEAHSDSSGKRTGGFIGGGAALGAIVGAIAGGGKGAAIGAGAGAAAGGITAIATSGREVRIPSESMVTFRVDHEMTMGVADNGSLEADHDHYHR